MKTFFDRYSIKNKIGEILVVFATVLFIVTVSITLAVVFKPLYYFDIQYLNIEARSGYSTIEIVENYNYVIRYLLNPLEFEFSLPSIAYSNDGVAHFKDVKRIFTVINTTILTSGLVSALGIIQFIKQKKFRFLKWTSFLLLILPGLLLVPLLTNFGSSFLVFHKLFFNNNLWLFDPSADPIINILPQEFFYHSALLILILIIFSSLALLIIHEKLYRSIKKSD